MAKEKTESVEEVEETATNEVADPGSAFKRVDQTQGVYDDSALSNALADLGRTEAARVEDEKPR